MKIESEFVTQAVVNALAELGVGEDADPQILTDLILNNAIHWQDKLSDGNTLTLLRLFSPVVDREEVFLGNVLLNDFISKTAMRALRLQGLQVETVIQDLETTFLLVSGSPLISPDLQEMLHDQVVSTLADLFLGEEDVAHGIQGNVERMLTFYKCNIDPFPVFVLPREMLPRLLEGVSSWIHTLIGVGGPKQLAQVDNLPVEIAANWRINVILSLLSYFFCQDGREMQSFHYFLTQAIEDGRLPAAEIKQAFGLSPGEEFDKKVFNNAKKDGAGVDFPLLNTAIGYWLNQVDQAILNGQAEAVAPYVVEKMFQESRNILTMQLLQGVQFGFAFLGAEETQQDTQSFACRLCGADVAQIPERNIVGGLKTGGRFNQSVQRNHERFCIRCAVSSYLITRRLGMQFDSGGFPIPKLYNIVFHYGRYEEWEIRALRRQIDLVLKESRAKKKTPKQILQDLAELRHASRSETESEIEEVYDDPEAALLALAEDPEPYVEPSLDVLAQMNSDIKSDVLALGAGSQQLLVFVLPQLRSGNKEGLDHLQRRFSHGRLLAFTLLAFLQEISGGDGPWYFRSLPRLTPGLLQAGHFYIRNQPEPVSHNLRRYGAIANFTRRVVNPGSAYERGRTPLTEQIVLADHLLADPLGTYSDVLRSSPKGKNDFTKDNRGKFSYRPLANFSSIDDTGIGVVDAREYLQQYRVLHDMAREEKTVPKHVPIKKVDEFCDKLFRTLDRASLLPMRMNEKAHAFEKHPRELVALLQRYEEVEAAFTEWETRILRQMHGSLRPYIHPSLQDLRQWMTSPDNRELFEGELRKDLLDHLKRSLYGRLYSWLYPRRRLAAAYAEFYKGEGANFTKEVVAKNFVQATQAVQQELDLQLSDQAMDDTRYILVNSPYYKNWGRNKDRPDFEDAEVEQETLV